MDCSKCRKLIMTTHSETRTESEAEVLATHFLHCEACAQFAKQVDQMTGLLGALPPQAPSEGFTASVMAQIRAADTPVHAPWYERAFGLLRAPTPVLSLRHGLAVAALVLMLVSGGIFAGARRAPGALPGPLPGADTISVADGGHVIEADREFFDVLVQRHRNADVTLPVSEDEGMRLVSSSY